VTQPSSEDTHADVLAIWGDRVQQTSTAVLEWNTFLASVRAGLGISRFDSGPIVQDGKLVCSDYTKAAALALSAQAAWWAALDPENQEAIRKAIPGLIPETAIQVGLARAIYGSAAMEIFSWQPLSHPIGGVAHYRVNHEPPPSDVPVIDAIGSLEPGASTRRIPELRLDIAVERIDLSNAEIREVRAVVSPPAMLSSEAIAQMASSEDQYGGSFGAEMVYCAIAEAFSHCERQMIGSALNAGRHETPTMPTISLAPEFEETALIAFTQASYQVHRRTMRGPANVIVVGPETAAPLMEFRSFSKRADRYPPVADQIRLHKIGILDRRYHVYCDALLGGRDVLMAYAGASFLDRGGIIAPWILIFSPTPSGLNVRLRAATKLVAAEHFQVVPTC